jgi:hypothetical protein
MPRELELFLTSTGTGATFMAFEGNDERISNKRIDDFIMSFKKKNPRTHSEGYIINPSFDVSQKMNKPSIHLY